MNDDRMITETGLEARIAKAALPVLGALGFRLVRVRLSGRDGLTVQVMADKDGGEISVEDCADISRDLGHVLDVEDLIDRAYNLEVSSPGIDRPLVRASDFEAWAGHEIRVEMAGLFEGRRRFRGTLKSADDQTAEVQFVDTDGEIHRSKLPMNEMAEARLVMSDDLIRASLKAAKANRKAAARAMKTNTDNTHNTHKGA